MNTKRTLFLLAVTAVAALSHRAAGQQLQLANPHWNVTLSDFGYSDFMLDNTPGFEGREYLSGEWAAAVAYQVANRSPVAPQWLEPQFVFPDWSTRSTFHAITPITQVGVNVDGLPIAQSVIANADLEITLRHEMVDTIVGIAMGTSAASVGGGGTSISSDRYVLKQTCALRNISGASISQLQLFQFLHGLQSQRGVYDNRLYGGPLSEFRYDVTQAGVDAGAVGAGSSGAGLEDFISFHASLAPSAYEVGYYGIEGNGVDDHAIGKPSDGVHLSVENNWETSPYSTRQGTDQFTPAQRWVAGAERWELGNLAAGQSVSFDVLLSLRTGTKVTSGPDKSGGCNGGSSVPGGVDYEFGDVSSDGSCFAEYSKADANEIEVHIAAGEFEPFTFLTPGEPAQIWKVEFSGTFGGAVHLTFGYDPTILPTGFNEDALSIYQLIGAGWQKLAGVVDPLSHTIRVTTTTLSVFVLGVESSVPFAILASATPGNSGVISGAGPYADGSSATLVATPNAGYVFSNWTENGTSVSVSPNLTLLVHSDRNLVANFTPVGIGRTISTTSLPASGGSTSGDGAYAPGATATVTATPNPGYKFSKWLENGVVVSTARDYTFTVTSDRTLMAKFKPVYAINVTADPPDGGEVEADPVYEFGELAVLKAKPNNGYCFVDWTQNGIPLSSEATFSFTVTGNRDLVGHFAFGNLVRASAEPANGGTASGAGVYNQGALVTLIAEANAGYVFVNWTENGNQVSISSAYSFTCGTNQTLVANFIAQPALHTFISLTGEPTLSWPAGASGWILQECSNLSPADWADSSRVITVIDGQKQVVIAPSPGNAFFRLTHR
jgi:hypothetical protein